jgi:hypothetical protein
VRSALTVRWQLVQRVQKTNKKTVMKQRGGLKINALKKKKLDGADRRVHVVKQHGRG